ncbi:MAG TPA: PaaI family thioesterase [Haliangiales bacterium]|nr:PaaI family thioesterase [Haliangiales bacterium]
MTPDLVAMMPFARLVGLAVERAAPEEVVGTLDWSPERCTTGGVLHGGAIVTLADTVGAICAFQHLPPGTTTGTIESKTNFFRPLARGRARATARPLHVGRSFIVVQTDVVDDDGRRVAQVTQTQAVIQPRTT